MTQDLSSQCINVSVGELVEFSCQQGNLHQDTGPAVDPRAGIAAHKRVQKAGGKGYQAEVVVEFDYRMDDWLLKVSGRADGVIDRGDRVIIEEIKTSWIDAADIGADAKALHLAQAKFYAYGLLNEKRDHCIALPVCELRLCYYHLGKQRAQREHIEIEYDAVKTFVEHAAKDYLQWQQHLQQAQRRRQRTISDLAMPYGGFRDGQRDIAEALYKTLATGRQLMTQAPTGIGKTLAHLYPALKAQGTGHVRQVWYLTAKVSGQKSAVEALGVLNEQAFHPSALVLTAKDKICPCKSSNSDQEADQQQQECDFCIGYFDRLPAARAALFDAAQNGVADKNRVLDVAQAHRICPFELGLDAARWLDIVIADYNYVFDPLIRLNRLLEMNADTAALLVDEAHNLPDRTRSAYSAELNPWVMRQAFSAVRKADRKAGRLLSALAECVDDLGRLPADGVVGQSRLLQCIPDTVRVALEAFFDRVDECRAKKVEFSPQLTPLFRMLYRFEGVVKLSTQAPSQASRQIDIPIDQTFQVLVRPVGRSDAFELALVNMHPAPLNAEMFARFKAVSVFSGSLVPMAFYAETSGLIHAQYLDIPSPFDPANAGIVVCPFVDMRYGHRDRYHQQIIDIVVSTVCAKAGNYLLCLPSYQMIETLRPLLEKTLPDYHWLYQSRDHSDVERHGLIDALADTGRPSILVAISGGWYAEGVDLPGDQLIGMIQFGVGLPQISDERRLMQQYAEAAHPGEGFAYTFEYPGFNKVLQSAGRVVRTASDKGVMVLVDGRFAEPKYAQLFPGHWQVNFVPSVEQLTSTIRDFWAGS
ncbi:Uncharacterised protein [BD1-7 clade bacterium]|uniref:Helicase ATP-binding domain-containing protein n=1 Tax=BD1-7 clade bacterium TaxID=2029982 RepID=A0A5S9PY14_9GAMM|nr:Uncharacterised protein [BD1-7 clade bacterium]CAA0109853.1 Uncharacterised protein [BD1-7 clade bacterium]CAA0116669.1 Uncharacterised protein [BD1-7 clade bacterium]